VPPLATVLRASFAISRAFGVIRTHRPGQAASPIERFAALAAGSHVVLRRARLVGPDGGVGKFHSHSCRLLIGVSFANKMGWHRMVR
jgi:hypothetical protein